MKIDKLEYYSTLNDRWDVWEKHPDKDDIVKKINEIINVLNKIDEVEKDDEMDDDETILEYFTKVLPHAELNLDKGQVPTFCPQELDNRLKGLCKPNYCDCYKCWTRKYKDSFEVKEDEN